MKTRKLTALILSILMIVTMLPTTIFAAPSAVTVADTANEQINVHNGETESGTADLSADDGTTVEIPVYAFEVTDAHMGGECLNMYCTYDAANGWTMTAGSETAIIAGMPLSAGDTIYLEFSDAATYAVGNLSGTTPTYLDVSAGTYAVTVEEDSPVAILVETAGSFRVYLAEAGADEYLYLDVSAAAEVWSGDVMVFFVDAYDDMIDMKMMYDVGNGVYVYPSEIPDGAVTVWFGIVMNENIFAMAQLDADSNIYILDGNYEEDGDVLIFSGTWDVYGICEHSVSEACGTCSECGKTCGTDFSHKFDEDTTCTVCGFACGTQSNPHDWSNKDGVCAVCDTECPKHEYNENYICTTCNYSYKAEVTINGESVVYETLKAAVAAAAASENSTVKLLDDVLYEGEIAIRSGNFTIDLNGKTVSSNGNTFYIVGDGTNITLVDNAGGGKVISTSSKNAAVYADSNAVLLITGGEYEGYRAIFNSCSITVQGGTFKSTGFRTVTNYGKLEITGGSFTAGGWSSVSIGASTFSASTIIKGGSFTAGSEGTMEYYRGVLDLSEHSDLTGFILKNNADSAVTPNDNTSDNIIKLPDGYCFYDSNNTAVTSLAVDAKYTIGKVQTVTTYTVSFSANPTEGGTVSGDGTYEEGASVTVTATANEGYAFVEWKENDEKVSEDASYTFTAAANRTLVANFEKLPEAKWGTSANSLTESGTLEAALTAAADDSNVKYVQLQSDVSNKHGFDIDGGEFTIDLNGNDVSCDVHAFIIKNSGTKITIIDSTGDGKVISTDTETNAVYVCGGASVIINGGAYEGGYAAIFVEDNTSSATIQSGKFNSIRGGTINNYGTLLIEGGDFTAGSYSAVSSDGATTITGGSFTAGSYGTIEYWVGKLDLSGYADPTGISLTNYTSPAVTPGEDTIKLPEGYCFYDSNNTAVSSLAANKTYTIGVTTYTVTISANPEAGGTVSGSGTYTEGASVTVTATANEGYAFVEWKENDETVSTNAEYTFTAEADRALTAVFEVQSYHIYYYVDGERVHTDEYEYGATIIPYEYTYGEGISFSGWRGLPATMPAYDLQITGRTGVKTFYVTFTINDELYTVIPFIYNSTVNAPAYEVPEGYSFSGWDIPERMPAKDLTLNATLAVEIKQIEIDLGTRASESNIRYAEINGIQTAIVENNDKYYVEIGEENLLVEIVEKTSADTAEVVKTQYFYVDMTAKTATKLDMDSYMQSYDETTIRTTNPMGIRFKAQALTSAKAEEEEYVIDEYGFIMAIADDLADSELNFEFAKYATGVAYNKADGKDIVYNSDDDDVSIFTGVLKNIPVANYKTDLVCKTYTKLTVNGEQFVVYGEAVTGNVYDTAQALLTRGGLDGNTEKALTKIIFDYENAIAIPGDDLYPEEA